MLKNMLDATGGGRREGTLEECTACVYLDSRTDQGFGLEIAAGAPLAQVCLLPVRLESPLTLVSGNPPVA